MAIGQAVKVSEEDFNFIVDNVFFPPKLPDHCDDRSEQRRKISALLNLLGCITKDYKKSIGKDEQIWSTISRMISKLTFLKDNEVLDAKKLENLIQEMSPGDVLALHISAQNAGLVLRYLNEDEITFESFEVSPTNSKVVTTNGSLVCSYPGPVLAVSACKIQDGYFARELASFLAKMDAEELEEALPTTRKAKTEVAEIRDTASPMFITEMLTGILRALGRPVDNPAWIQKRIRDDVCYENAERPWRRHGIWLVIKVAIQTTLEYNERTKGGDGYKEYMLYVLSRLSSIAAEKQLPSDLLFVMNAKVGRRASKAKLNSASLSMQTAKNSIDEVSTVLHDRWNKLQHEQHGESSWSPSDLYFEKDTALSLRNSRKYLETVMNRGSAPQSQGTFAPNHRKRLCLDDDALSEILDLKARLPSEHALGLLDFEDWVEKRLEIWIKGNQHRESACHDIVKALDKYANLAQSIYAGQPVDLSRMVLTSASLWMALDKIALTHRPLLAEYGPAIPRSIFENLLLPKLWQMARLYNIEKYLGKRWGSCHFSNPCIFSKSFASNTFAVRFFDASSAHQELEKAITRDAQIVRDAKNAEYYAKTSEYADLTKKASRLSCSYYTNSYTGYRYHCGDCKKCQIERQASNIKIDVHEWPLPSDSLECKTVVFELMLPEAFSAWRDGTYKFLVDVCAPEFSSDTKEPDVYGEIKLKDLSRYFKGYESQRITLASHTKPFTVSHYSTKDISSTFLSSVCVPSGLRYQPFDSHNRLWTEGAIESWDISSICTLQIQTSPYQVLQYAVDSTCHTSNEVIARQSECPAEISLHEYESFGTLRAGHRLQWKNIARELRSRILSFRKDAVDILISQAIWQAGPMDEDTVLREAHAGLSDAIFARTLLAEIEEMWKDIENNWLESTCAKVLITLTARVLALCTDRTIKHHSCRLLRKGREVTIKWTRELADKLQRCKNQIEITGIRNRVLLSALCCRSSYDVDVSDLLGVLTTHSDVAIAVECAIIIHDNTPAITSQLPSVLRTALKQDQVLSHALESTLKSLGASGNEVSGVSTAISKAWSGYIPGEPWTAMQAPDDRWLHTRTGCASSEDRPLSVHYNLLDGQLLVGGVPLARMPLEYVQHPTYLRLFGDKIFDVTPTTMSIMQYQTKLRTHGLEVTGTKQQPFNSSVDYEVFFAMVDGELLVRTRCQRQICEGRTDWKVLELVPHVKLLGDLPVHLIEPCAHWLDPSTGEMEFRMLKKPWNSTPYNWRLFYSSTGSHMKLGHKRLIDVRSPSFAMIHGALHRIEMPENTEITLKYPICTTPAVFTRLPRLKLDFFINTDDKLECKQFRGMTVDSSQALGTLHGLESRLVLRPGVSKPDGSRKVIVPYSDRLCFGRLENHAFLRVDTSKLKKVDYYTFDIDRTLQRLVGNSSLASRLWKIYLHAVTAHCLPDSLTGRTGTEEALYDLKSAATWSFQHLKQESREVELLGFIASLTPERVFYPKNLMAMQTVTWGPLPMLSQHEEFHQTVHAIIRHAKQFEIFHGEEEPLQIEAKSSEFLIDRAAVRNAAYRTYEFGGYKYCERTDKVHRSRHNVPESSQPRELAVYKVARGMESPGFTGDAAHPDLMQALIKWDTIASEKARLGYCVDVLRARDLASQWIQLYNHCRNRQSSATDYPLMFFLCSIAYMGNIDIKLVWTLVAFSKDARFRYLPPPNYPQFMLTNGWTPKKPELMNELEDSALEFDDTRSYGLTRTTSESEYKYDQRRQSQYRQMLLEEKERVVNLLVAQWPCEEVSMTLLPSHLSILRPSQVKANIAALFRTWYRNKLFVQHITEVQAVLESMHSATNIEAKFLDKAKTRKHFALHSAVKLDDLVTGISTSSVVGRPVLCIEMPTVTVPHGPRKGHEEAHDRLCTLIAGLRDAEPSCFRNSYAADLQESRAALETSHDTLRMLDHINSKALISAFKHHKNLCKAHMKGAFEDIRYYLTPPSVANGPNGMGEELLYKTGLWPKITPVSLLRTLAIGSATSESSWKEVLVAYGQSIAIYQRAERLYRLAEKGSYPELSKELENTGFEGWNPTDSQYHDWLLMQIDNNMLIRPVQADIASRMMSSGSSNNTNRLFQLNMGEGKSSVIVPIMVTGLADRNKLVRVVVLKPLATQMFRLLVQKIGDLTNRRVYYMPFSRDVKLDSSRARKIRALYEECLQLGGVLLVQSEHMLSFKLIGLERLFTANDEVAQTLVETQEWLETKSRDLLDESDEILHQRYQLIYTVGAQNPVEHAPDRWIVIQQIFGRIRGLVNSFDNATSHTGFERQSTARDCLGAFPIVRILHAAAGKFLVAQLASDVCDGRLSAVSLFRFPNDLRKLASRFIQDNTMTSEESAPLMDYVKSGEVSKGTLLLLRGLLAHGIIQSLLEKRWRVDYGLAPERTMLAVPYRAKDSPAPRAEYSHPDVVLSLTCLSYYYAGLTDLQLQTCFDMLFKLDNQVARVYDSWLEDCEYDRIPENLRTSSGINMEDLEQRKQQVFPFFRHNKRIIDYYLAEVVFPKSAKEFPSKLSTSAWDLAESKEEGQITGFSGTCDNRYLLPLSITQKNLPEQLGTNAKVLRYLLQPENDHYVCACGSDGERLQVDALLPLIISHDPSIRVILDVGAQVLEWDNHRVAKNWLSLVGDAVQAAVFFNESDELVVLSHDGTMELLMLSSFVNQMDQCLVYLDEVHTRGTDLKLPLETRAAVTLGPHLTKDRLAQACMRLRQLGEGQSITCFAPPEVHRKILEASPETTGQVGMFEVLRWTISETLASITHGVPLWADQGLKYQQRRSAWQEYSKNSDISVLKSKMMEQEAQSLEELYGFIRKPDPLATPVDRSNPRYSQVKHIRKKCREFGIESLHGLRQQEEQEREVAHEAEREQQVERPPRANPFKHRLHQDLVRLVDTGVFNHSSPAFLPAFQSLSSTTAGKHLVKGWLHKLLVTKDFAQTIKRDSESMDDYIRPVRWILSTRDATLIIISPYEANELLPKIQKLCGVRLHVYAPRITKSMRSFEDLSFCTESAGSFPPVAPELVAMLNLFSGQLFFRDAEEYVRLCSLLGIYTKETPESGGVQSDGFVKPENRASLAMSGACGFEESPIAFLRRTITLRRKGQDYLDTHIGQLLHGRPLFISE